MSYHSSIGDELRNRRAQKVELIKSQIIEVIDSHTVHTRMRNKADDGETMLVLAETELGLPPFTAVIDPFEYNGLRITVLRWHLTDRVRIEWEWRDECPGNGRRVAFV